MKKPVLITAAFAFCAALIISVAGCENDDLSNVKKHRLIAAENRQLKKQLEQYQAQIETLNKQHNAEMERQTALLEKCRQEKEGWKTKSQQNFEQQAGEMVNVLMSRISELNDENQQLKAEIETLKTEMQSLRRELETP